MRHPPEASRKTPDLDRSAIPRYIQLATMFRRRIESGQWTSGAQIPTVDELAAEFGVARATIRQALDQLAEEQLIQRFRAKGTFVAPRPKAQIWCEVSTNWSGLLLAREGATIEIIEDGSVARPPSIPHPIGSLAAAYRHLRRLHRREGMPFLLADVYIAERLRSKIPKRALTTMTALKLAADIPGIKIASAAQSLTIGSADLEAANYLGLPLNAPVAHVSRSAVDQTGELFLVANGIYRGDVVRIDAKLK